MAEYSARMVLSDRNGQVPFERIYDILVQQQQAFVDAFRTELLNQVRNVAIPAWIAALPRRTGRLQDTVQVRETRTGLNVSYEFYGQFGYARATWNKVIPPIWESMVNNALQAGARAIQ